VDFVPEAMVLIADGNVLSLEETIEKDVEAESIGVRCTWNLHGGDSITCAAGRAEFLCRSVFPLSIENETRWRQANQFLTGCSKAGTNACIGQIENIEQRHFERQNQFWIAGSIRELAVRRIEESLYFSEGGDAAVRRIENGKGARRVVAASVLQCTHRGERIASPAIFDDTIAVTGIVNERRGVQDRVEAFNRKQWLLSIQVVAHSSRSHTSPEAPDSHPQ